MEFHKILNINETSGAAFVAATAVVVVVAEITGSETKNEWMIKCCFSVLFCLFRIASRKAWELGQQWGNSSTDEDKHVLLPNPIGFMAGRAKTS